MLARPGFCIFFFAACVTFLCFPNQHIIAQGKEQIVYPETRRVDQVDDYFGVAVPDPYRWLETDVRQSDEVAQWVAEQNKVTFAYLEKLPYRAEIEKRLTQLWDFEKYGVPEKAGDYYYYEKNDGLQNQSVLYQVKQIDDKQPRVLIDPNKWKEDGTAALAGTVFSHDGKLLAYSVADAGSDWTTWRVMQTKTQKVLEDEIRWIKFGSVAWTLDGAGFFYPGYDEPPAGQEFEALNLSQKIYYHKLGTQQSDDTLILETPDNPEWGFGVEVTEDGRYLVITVWKGTDDKYRVKFKDLADEKSQIIDLIDTFDNEYAFIGNAGSIFYFRTDLNAPRKAIVSVDVSQQERQWKTVVAEASEVMESVSMVGDMLITQYLKDATSLVKLWALNGEFVRQVELPGIGSVSGFAGRRDQQETFYSFSSFATPPSIYRYELSSGKSELTMRAKVDFDPAQYEVKQVFYASKDGTKVPMFIAHKKGLKLDGKNPTLLYAYGGFNISLLPRFSISRLQWMEMGGVFAMPNLRGGGEYGEEWHRAGTKLHKQNVFDDFIAAAQWLIDNQYCSSSKLAIQGGSNGGLLVGACETQRPDLFGACLPSVGVMDMLQFHKWTAGRFWVDDYGSSEHEEEFRALYAYSPYHNIKDGTHYPPTLITTADTDDRVVPRHSFKFAARLQHAQAGDAPTLIRIETSAGHGAGTPTSKIIEEIADEWAFLVKSLDMQPTLGREK
jgi:prolyl oligopeptidase